MLTPRSTLERRGAAGRHGVALLHVTAERDGRHLDVTVVHVIHVRDGKVAEVWVHPRDSNALDEFWG
jgi:ketosteroid isomerase-like protein